MIEDIADSPLEAVERAGPGAGWSSRRNGLPNAVRWAVVLMVVVPLLLTGACSPKTVQGPGATATGLPGFSPAGPMANPRSIHSAVALRDGRVAIIGGNVLAPHSGSPVTGSVEVFDPNSGSFVPGASLREPRQTAAAVTLLDGLILVTGGIAADGLPLRSAELVDLAASASSPAGNMSIERYGHSMALLPDGRVLVVGGSSQAGPLASTELFDPSTKVFTPGPMMRSGRARPSTVSLNDGSILVVSDGTAERYEPALRSFSLVSEARDLPEVPALLPDGRVLLTGGIDPTLPQGTPRASGCPDGGCGGAPFPATSAAVLLDASSGRVTPVPSMREARMLHQAISLKDGRVLVAGGATNTQFERLLATAEVYDPRSSTFTTVGAMAQGRVWFTLSLLESGQVLVVGADAFLDVPAEVFTP